MRFMMLLGRTGEPKPASCRLETFLDVPADIATAEKSFSQE